MSFSVASYNTLATAYIQLAQYRRTPAMVLSSEWRIPALAARLRFTIRAQGKRPTRWLRDILPAG